MKSKKFKLSAIVFYSVIIALALVLPTMGLAAPVPDTGQTQSYTNTFGEDSDYTCNPHSYTDIGNGVVKDNVTGLEWQQATATGTYTWQLALDYVAGMNSDSGTYGHTDWRLPTIKELSTLVDSGIPYPGPPINTSYFPDTVVAYYWSSTTLAYNTDYANIVYFGNGYVGYYGKIFSDYVRAVRGGQSTNNFVDNGNGTITDTSTGLMWQKATAPGIYTWEQALTYCENLTLPAGGYSDWRLPNRNELQSIVDYSRYNPAIDTTFFPDTVGTVASDYWSSTTNANYTDYRWYLDFYDGGVGNGGPSEPSSGYVRAVRGGQCSASTTTTTTPYTPPDNRPYVEFIDENGCPIQYDQGGGFQFENINANTVPSTLYYKGIVHITPGYCYNGKCFTCYDLKIENKYNTGLSDVKNWANVTDGQIVYFVVDTTKMDKTVAERTNLADIGVTFYQCGDSAFAQPPQGLNLNKDSNGCPPVTVISLSSFTATPKAGKIILEWKTETEIDNAGFNIYRYESENGQSTQLNSSLISANGSTTQGASYKFIDTNVQNRKMYYYKLEDIDLSGKSTMHGPVNAMPRWIYGVSK